MSFCQAPGPGRFWLLDARACTSAPCEIRNRAISTSPFCARSAAPSIRLPGARSHRRRAPAGLGRQSMLASRGGGVQRRILHSIARAGAAHRLRGRAALPRLMAGRRKRPGAAASNRRDYRLVTRAGFCVDQLFHAFLAPAMQAAKKSNSMPFSSNSAAMSLRCEYFAAM